MKKYLPFILILFVLIGLFSPRVSVLAQYQTFEECRSDGNDEAYCAQDQSYYTCVNNGANGCVSVLGTPQDTGTGSSTSPLVHYELLQPLPCKNGDAGCDANGQLKVYNPSGTGKLGQYLNLMINLFIGLCAVAALVMIVLGGIEYSGSELISGKEAGKERIKNAIFGLLLALCSWLILYTINPDLLNTEVDIGNATLTSNGEITIADLKEIITPDGTSGTGGAIDINSVGTICDARKILSTAESNGYSITSAQATTFACLARFESQGCKSTTNYSWGSGSSAYGAFQVTLQSNSRFLENQTCYAAAGIPGPLRCNAGFRNGNPIPSSPYYQQCIKAAGNFACNLSAAVGLMKNRPSFADWTADPHCQAMGSRCPQAQCIAKFNH